MVCLKNMWATLATGKHHRVCLMPSAALHSSGCSLDTASWCNQDAVSYTSGAQGARLPEIHLSLSLEFRLKVCAATASIIIYFKTELLVLLWTHLHFYPKKKFSGARELEADPSQGVLFIGDPKIQGRGGESSKACGCWTVVSRRVSALVRTEAASCRAGCAWFACDTRAKCPPDPSVSCETPSACATLSAARGSPGNTGSPAVSIVAAPDQPFPVEVTTEARTEKGIREMKRLCGLLLFLCL